MSLLVQSQNTTAVSVVNAAETTLITAGPLGVPRDSSVQLILWYVEWIYGGGEAGEVFRIRRGPTGTTADTLVGPATNINPFASTSGTNGARSGFVVDNAPSLGPVIYSLSIVRTGGTDTRNTVSQGIAVFLLF